MASVDSIPAGRAQSLTAARVIEVLDSKFGSEVDTELNRNADDEIFPPDNNYDGLYLPDPQEYVEQPSPTTQELNDLQNVAFYSGQRAPTTYGEESAYGGDGYYRSADVPWAVSFVAAREFGASAVSHPVLSRDLKDEERVEARARFYRDMIAWTIDKWGHLGTGSNTRAHAIKSTQVVDTFGAALRMRVGEELNLYATGYVQFDIDQWQHWPEDSYT